MSRASSHPAFASLWTRTYDAAYRRAPADPSVDEADHVLVAIPSGGSLGDQSMVEAFLEHVPGSIVVIARSLDDVEVPVSLRPRVTVLASPELFRFVPLTYYKALKTFKGLLGANATVSLLGADVMDGGYSVRRSMVRAQLARLAAQEGHDARILGFSWNGRADGRARRQLALAHEAGVRLFARDTRSAERLRSDGMRQVEEAADLAFTGTRYDDAGASRWLDGIGGGRRVALVNMSALIDRRMDQLAEYRLIVERLLHLGFAVVLVPHDDRLDNDDVAQCRRLAVAMPNPEVRFVDRLPTIAIVRSLARRASVTISGRMHLAILSLQQGTPTVALSTQGKVEGLMELVGTPGFDVEPTAGFGTRIVELLDERSDHFETTRARIRARLPAVIERAQKNFDGLAD